MGGHLLLVPSFKLRATFGFYAVGVVVMLVGHGAHVLLQGGDVEKNEERTPWLPPSIQRSWETRLGTWGKSSDCR